MKQWLVVDLDGTVCDCSHRVDFARAKDWDNFHARLVMDKPFEDTIRLINSIGLKVMAVTGRNERYRNQTVTWLIEHHVHIDVLLMRPDDDWRKDGEVKLSLLEGFFGNKPRVLEEIVACLDDRDQVVEAFRNYGLACWQVRDGAF